MAPMWVNWTWSMERYCGILGSVNKSRRNPYISLGNRLVQTSQLLQIFCEYNLQDRLSLELPKPDVSRHETRVDGCECSNIYSLSSKHPDRLACDPKVSSDELDRRTNFAKKTGHILCNGIQQACRCHSTMYSKCLREMGQASHCRRWRLHSLGLCFESKELGGERRLVCQGKGAQLFYSMKRN